MNAETISKVESVLSHVGIKGMRWGVRKAETKPGGNNVGINGKANHRKLSDDDLKAVVSRLKLEQEFINLTAPSAHQKRGERFLDGVGKKVFQGVVIGGVNKAGSAYVESLLKKQLKIS